MASAPLLFPLLKDLCARAVATNFGSAPTYGGLGPDAKKAVNDRIPVDLPIEVALPLIDDESYWERRSRSLWSNVDLAPHGGSWKQLWVEKTQQDALERYDAAVGGRSGPDELRRLLAFCRRFAHSLRLSSLPSHADVEPLLEAMGHAPAVLALTYGLRVGLAYDRAAFGMRLSDCRGLARALARAETLVSLNLSNNSLDDDRVRMLASGLADNITVTEVNLSHNRISDRGARALAKLLHQSSVVARLDLSDNQLHADGGQALARALGHSRALECLRLRLNRLGDEGCGAICEALGRPPQPKAAAAAGGSSEGGGGSPGGGGGSSGAGGSPGGSGSSVGVRLGPGLLTQLDLSANGAGVGLVLGLCALLRANTTLLELNVSSNLLGPLMARELLGAAAANAGLLALDVRGCGLGEEAEAGVAEEMVARLERRQRAQLLSGSGGAGLACAAGG